MGTQAESMKLECEAEACCVCGASDEELFSPEEHDAGAAPPRAPLRAMMLHLNHNKVLPNGRLCSACIRHTQESYNFSMSLSAKGPPPLSEKIRALRKRLHELTQKIDVFIVVGGGGGAGEGAYSEEDIITVERGALEAAADEGRAPDARGDPVYQCTVCPTSFHRMSELRAHLSLHPRDAPHVCWTCGERLPHAAAAARHAAAHAPPRALHCHLCDTTFQSQSEMRRHEPSCRSACPACGAEHPSRGALRAHCVSAPDCGVCPDCFLACGGPEARAAHAILHRRDRHFVCGYKACILRFHTRSNLLAHIRKCHGGGEPAPLEEPPPAGARPAVPCARCPRRFGSVAAMKRHARTHRHKDTQDADAGWGVGAGEEEAEGAAGVEYLEMDALDDTLA